MKLLVVYNCCGLSGKENSAQYLKSIASINNQSFNKFELIISGCCLLEETKRKLLMYHPNVLLINEIHPVNCTFNKAIDVGIQKFGIFDGYLYVDSGSNFTDINCFKKMIEVFNFGNYGMVTPQPSTDTEYHRGLKVGRYDGDPDILNILFKDGNYIIKPGTGMGSHVNLISEKMRSFYGRCYPDIMASIATESIFAYMCSAIKLQWVLLKDCIVEQTTGVDGASFGFKTIDHVMKGGHTWDHPYKIKSIVERLCTPEAYEIGMGWENAQNIFPHNPLCYDPDTYHCENDELKDFIKENCFLKKEELDYESINYDFR